MKKYINKKLGFYFGEGGFEQMIVEAQLDQEEIKEWGSLAVLFDHCFDDISEFTDQEKDDAYSLIESLYIKLEVDLMFGEIEKDSLHEICEGYEFSANMYKNEIDRGVEFIEVHGLELYRKI